MRKIDDTVMAGSLSSIRKGLAVEAGSKRVSYRHHLFATPTSPSHRLAPDRASVVTCEPYVSSLRSWLTPDLVSDLPDEPDCEFQISHYKSHSRVWYDPPETNEFHGFA